MATDWPGHYPNVAGTIDLLTQAGGGPPLADARGELNWLPTWET